MLGLISYFPQLASRPTAATTVSRLAGSGIFTAQGQLTNHRQADAPKKKSAFVDRPKINTFRQAPDVEANVVRRFSRIFKMRKLPMAQWNTRQMFRKEERSKTRKIGELLAAATCHIWRPRQHRLACSHPQTMKVGTALHHI